MINPVIRSVVILAVIVMNESVIQPECNEGEVKAFGDGNYYQYLECTNGESGNTWVTRDCGEEELFNTEVKRCLYTGAKPYERYPDPDDCTGYFVCQVNGCQHLSCSQGSAFNKDIGICQLAHELPDCKILVYPNPPIYG